MAMQKVLPGMPEVLERVAQTTPMDLLRIAVEKGDINTIERLVALEEKVQGRAAEAEFNAALNRAQNAMGRVAADATNPQTHSKYATYAAIDREVRPIYTREGLALSFDTGDAAQPENLRVICHVSHSAGHTRTYRVDMPADGKGAKGGDVMTKTHAAGAAMSYGMRYLVKFIFNIAVGEDDNDGNVGEQMTEQSFDEYADNIKNATTAEELKASFGTAWKVAGSIKDTRAQSAFQAIYDARKKAVR